MFLWMIYVARTGNVSSETNQGRQNQALEQTRDNVLRYGEVVGCELLNFFVLSRRPEPEPEHRNPEPCWRFANGEVALCRCWIGWPEQRKSNVSSTKCFGRSWRASARRPCPVLPTRGSASPSVEGRSDGPQSFSAWYPSSVNSEWSASTRCVG